MSRVFCFAAHLNSLWERRCRLKSQNLFAAHKQPKKLLCWKLTARCPLLLSSSRASNTYKWIYYLVLYLLSCFFFHSFLSISSSPIGPIETIKLKCHKIWINTQQSLINNRWGNLCNTHLHRLIDAHSLIHVCMSFKCLLSIRIHTEYEKKIVCYFFHSLTRSWHSSSDYLIWATAGRNNEET